MIANRTGSRRERALLSLVALLAVVAAAVQLTEFYQDRAAKILTLRSDIAARSFPADASSAAQREPLPAPWFSERDHANAALRLHGDLEERATEIGLRVESIHTSTEPGESVEAQARTKGNYAETIAFLAALEQSEPPLLITALTLTRVSKDSGGAARLDSAIAVRGYLHRGENADD